MYFGYGANLSVDRFTRHQMNVKDLGNAVLAGHEIKFSLANEYKGKGYAGMEINPSAEVWGVLYEIDYLSLRLMDVMEWCGFGAYVRKKVIVKTMNGEERECFGYFVKNPQRGLFPSTSYLANMISSAESRGFPQSYILFLKSHEYREKFDIDHGFSLFFYGRRRPLEKDLLPFYRLHDKLREKLCELI